MRGGVRAGFQITRDREWTRDSYLRVALGSELARQVSWGSILMQNPDSSVVLVRSASIPVDRDVLDGWHRHSPAGLRLHDHEVSEADTAESLLRMLLRESARVVVFLGNHLPDAVVISRLAGMRVVLITDERLEEIPSVHDWRDARATAICYAHCVVALGCDWPMYQGQQSEIGWGAHYFARDLADVDLRHVVQMAEGQVDPAPVPPLRASTYWHARDELTIWRACRGDRLAEEADLIRERCLQDLKSRAGGAVYRSTRLAPSARGRERQRVLFVSHELTKTGAPTGMLWAMRGLKELGVEFESWCIGIGDGPMADDFREVVGDERFKIVDYDSDWPHYADFLEAVDEIDPDVVFLNASPVYALAPLLRWKGIPVVWWFHDGINVARRDGHLFSLGSLEAMHRYALATASVVLTASQNTAEQLEIFCDPIAKPVGVVPYGFDVDALIATGQELKPARDEIREALGVPDDGTLFVCVGSLEQRKNQRRLVAAFQSMLRKMPAMESSKHGLALVGRLDPDNKGADSYYHEILGVVEEDFASQVHIVGPQPSGAPYMVAADCHVLISTNECSPLVNIESMLLETAVISSKVHGIPEVVLEGVRGRLVEPEDDGNIEDVLTWFVDSRRDSSEELNRMRQAGLDYAKQNHDYVQTGRMVLEHLEKALSSEGAAQMRIVGAGGNRALERELMIRWSWMKHDAVHACHALRERMLGASSANASLPE